MNSKVYTLNIVRVSNKILKVFYIQSPNQGTENLNIFFQNGAQFIWVQSVDILRENDEQGNLNLYKIYNRFNPL